MTTLAGTRILVTGASRGIGRAIALACGAAGAHVGVNYHRSEEQARSLCESIGPTSRAVCFDVGAADAVAQGIEAFVAFAGGIDGLVNNAGINLPSLLVAARDEEIAAMIATNLVGPILCTRAVLPAMVRQRSGVIVNVGSVAAERPFRGQSVYAATKGGLESLTRAVAVEYGRKGIRCHCVRPGAVDTEMLAATRAIAEEDLLARIPLRRIATADEIARFVILLLGDQLSYATGSIHSIDGGFSAG